MTMSVKYGVFWDVPPWFTAEVVPSSLIVYTQMMEVPPKRRFLKEPQGVTPQKTVFFIVACYPRRSGLLHNQISRGNSCIIL
jgi:hypothetical protein